MASQNPWRQHLAMIEGPGVVGAALVGITQPNQPASIWAATDNFNGASLQAKDAAVAQVADENLKSIMAALKDETKFQSGGFHLYDEAEKKNKKYLVMRVEDNFIHGKQGAEGAMICNFGKGIAVVAHSADAIPGTIRNTLEKYCDYLRRTLQ
ncbi:hypothetical protein GGF46_004627 [Coemansia sp. RSA 552]|nr:hypothetical protein GGF46_004627 [Coemansia sp. RSA 552]